MYANVLSYFLKCIYFLGLCTFLRFLSVIKRAPKLIWLLLFVFLISLKYIYIFFLQFFFLKLKFSILGSFITQLKYFKNKISLPYRPAWPSSPAKF